MENQELVNRRIKSIPPSVTLGVTSKAKEMTAAGREVLSFAAGEPDFDTPDNIKKAACDALAAGQTKYTPVAGLLSLRKAIAEKLSCENHLSYDPSQIIVSNGAKHSLFNVFMTICNENDEIIIPSPYWLSYPEMVNVAGGKPVFVQGDEKNDFKMTPAQFEAAVTGRTKAVIINSPSNPIGIVYTEPELRAIAEIAADNGIYIVCDEIYENMVYDNTVHVSVGALSEKIFNHTITVNGFSKAYSMTGWRLGYFAAPLEIARAASALQSHSTSGPNTFAQFGAIEALKNSAEASKQMVRAFAERRTCLLDRLNSIQGITCVKPMGAFYMFPNISEFGLDSVTFCEQLLEKQSVAAVPGAPFGSDRHIRLSYACSLENINKGMAKLAAFTESL